MSLDRFNATRLGLQRTTELGMALSRRRGASPKGTIVYIHGLGESSLCFEALLSDPRLGAWDHLAVDLLGYGRSRWPERAMGLEQHAASIELLLEKLELDDVILAGHSMGGVIALLLAERGRIHSRFVLDIEGNVTFDDCGFSRLAEGQDQETWLKSGYAAFIDRIHELAEEGRDRDEAGDSKGESRDESTDRAEVMRAYGASAHFADPRTLHLDSLDLVRLSRGEKLAERRGAVRTPMVYFYGATRGTAGYSLGQLEDAGIKTRAFEPAGHWPFLDQHDAFVDAMVETLGGLE